MKSFRLWLLLLLAVLLPVRGALAVGMDCALPGSQAQVEAQAQLSSGHVHHAQGAAHHQAAADRSDDGAHSHGGPADKCNLCAASCSASALVSASMTVADPRPASSVFPRLRVAYPRFLSDGQERPPRTI